MAELIAQRFELEHLAGEGGMGAVYRALDRATGRRVAVKLLHETRLKQSARFEREARLLAELDHPAIVRYVAHGSTESGRAYLAMDWLEGESLEERLCRGRLTIAESVRLGRRVGDALGAAHARGIVHRDLKPNNLFLVGGAVDDIRLVDFGIARLPGRTQLTDTGAMLGTVGYMAPEQARGESTVDARADVFALGAVLFRCLTGRAPFEADDPLATLLLLAQHDAPPTRALRPAVPRALDDVVLRMLARDPALRPADGAAARDALASIPDDAIRQADHAPDTPAEALRHDAAAGEVSAIASSRTGATERAIEAPARPPARASRRAWTLLVASAAIVALGAAGVSIALRTRRGADPVTPASAPIPCGGERCVPFEVPDWSAVDLRDLVAPARALAATVEPKVALRSMAAAGVTNGTVDFAGGAGVNFEFTFAQSNPAPGATYGVVMVAAFRRQLTLTRAPPADAQRDLAYPSCSSRAAWQAAVATGMPADNAGVIAYATIGGPPVWLITLPDPPPARTWLVDGATCAAQSLSPTESTVPAATEIDVQVTNKSARRLTGVAVEFRNGEWLIGVLGPGEVRRRRLTAMPQAIRYNDGSGEVRGRGSEGLSVTQGCAIGIELDREPRWQYCTGSAGERPPAAP